jgi:hypothetical protein
MVECVRCAKGCSPPACAGIRQPVPRLLMERELPPAAIHVGARAQGLMGGRSVRGPTPCVEENRVTSQTGAGSAIDAHPAGAALTDYRCSSLPFRGTPSPHPRSGVL